jgi:hypothetical protein
MKRSMVDSKSGIPAYAGMTVLLMFASLHLFSRVHFIVIPAHAGIPLY